MPASDYPDIILALHRDGKSERDILKEVQKHDPKVTRYAIRKFLRGFYTSNLLTLKRRYQPRGLSEFFGVIKYEIVRSYAADSSATATAICRSLNARGVSVSLSQIKFLRSELGFKRASTKYCQFIREKNKEQRMAFCEEMIRKEEKFMDCVFTDESIFQVGCATKYCYITKGGDKARLRSRPKHPAKVQVWGGISSKGPTDLAIFPGSVRIDSKTYCDVLQNCYLGFAEKKFGGHARLVHDNAPAHRSAYTTRKLDSWGIETVNWPAESPDLNAIELVWGSMKASFRHKQFRNTEELCFAIREFWKTLTPAVCQRYIESIQWKMPLVVKARGGNIIEKKPIGGDAHAEDSNEDF